jgi:hypothetical protein
MDGQVTNTLPIPQEVPVKASETPREEFVRRAAILCADIESDSFWDEPEEFHSVRLRELHRFAFEVPEGQRKEALHMYDMVAKKLFIARELHRMGLDCNPEEEQKVIV